MMCKSNEAIHGFTLAQKTPVHNIYKENYPERQVMNLTEDDIIFLKWRGKSDEEIMQLIRLAL